MTEGEETAEKNKTDEEKKTEETEEKKDDEKVNIQKSYELCKNWHRTLNYGQVLLHTCALFFFQEKAEEKPTEKIEDDVKLEKEKLAEAETPAAAPEVTA